MDLIKKKYLGGPKEKKKLIKLSDKFKFNFEWDDTKIRVLK